MITDLQGSETVVSRLRLNAATSDPALATMRLASLLRDAPLHPANLPPAAILFIRRLHDPRPGALRLDQSGGHLPALWDQAAKELISRLGSGAARPALGAIAPSANAVVFLDRSELLACLASDWCQGSVTTRWWWQSLLKQGAASQIVKELWQRTPEYVPAAIAQLASRNQAADFVRTWSDEEAHQLLRGVAKSFALHSLLPVLDVFASATNSQSESTDVVQLKTVRPRERDESPRSKAPWRQWVTESDGAGLGTEQELLLGVALMLQRAPARIRAAHFQTEVRDWQQGLASVGEPQGTNQKSSGAASGTSGGPSLRSPDAQPGKSQRTEPQVIEERGLPLTARLPELIASKSAMKTDRERESIDAVAIDPSAARRARPTQINKFRRRDLAGAQKNIEAISPLSAGAKIPSFAATVHEVIDPPGRIEDGSSHVADDPQTIPAHVEAVTASDESYLSTDALSATPAATFETDTTEEWVETEFGGLFYLINLGIFLGLYGDFTTPDEPGLQLNIWDFVALVGRELVGEDLENDPVWSLLARLAQRKEGDLPGDNFEPPDDPSLEFQVPSFKLAKKLAGKAELETQNSKLETSPAVAAWLRRLLPYIRVRLQQALGLAEADDPGPVICRQDARVCLTPTHIDLFFRLSELPIEIRLSGLDRDPGWVPAAGKFITFHFE